MTATAIVLDFEKHRLHALKRGELLWFILADVCETLGLDNPSMVAARLEPDQKNTLKIVEGNRGNPNVTIVSEDAVYEIACTSRKPIAKRFKRWLYRTVLPEIRRTGAYNGTSAPLDGLLGSVQPELDLTPTPEVEQPADDDLDDTNARQLWIGHESPLDKKRESLPMFKRNEWVWIENDGDATCMVTQRNYPEGKAMMLRFVSDAAPTSTRLRVLEPSGKRLLICVDHVVSLAIVLRAYARLGRGPMAETTLNTLRHYLAR